MKYKETEADKKIIHLYVISKCTNKCPFCCNNEYDVNDIPVVTIEEMKTADTICLTGGEPFLNKDICNFAQSIKEQYPNIKTIYVYTSGASLYNWLGQGTLHHIDGVNISPKGEHDKRSISLLFGDVYYLSQIYKLKSSRFYQFAEIPNEWVSSLNIDKNSTMEVVKREWQEHFEPVSGIFRRLPILLPAKL